MYQRLLSYHAELEIACCNWRRSYNNLCCQSYRCSCAARTRSAQDPSSRNFRFISECGSKYDPIPVALTERCLSFRPCHLAVRPSSLQLLLTNIGIKRGSAPYPIRAFTGLNQVSVDKARAWCHTFPPTSGPQLQSIYLVKKIGKTTQGVANQSSPCLFHALEV